MSLAIEALTTTIKEEAPSPKGACPCGISGAWVNFMDTRAGRVYLCGGCGTGRLLEIDGQRVLKPFTEYPDKVKKGVELYAAAAPARIESARKLLGLLESFVPERGKLLEFGPHVGFFLDEARKSGWTVSGVEPNPHAVEWGRRHIGLDTALTCGTLEDFPLEESENRFSAVVLANVLGHLADPGKAIKKCHRLLNRGGSLVIQTPILDNPVMRLPGFMRNNWRYFIDTYFWYFTRDGLGKLLEKSGFEISQLSLSSRPTSLAFACDRILNLRPTPNGDSPGNVAFSLRAACQEGVNLLANSRFGQLQIDLGPLGDCVDVIARKP